MRRNSLVRNGVACSPRVMGRTCASSLSTIYIQSVKKRFYSTRWRVLPNKTPIQSNLGKTPESKAAFEAEYLEYQSRWQKYGKAVRNRRFYGYSVPNFLLYTFPLFAIGGALLLYVNHKAYKQIKNEGLEFNGTLEELYPRIAVALEKNLNVGTGASLEDIKQVAPGVGHWIHSFQDLFIYAGVFIGLSALWVRFRTWNLFRAFVNSRVGTGLSFEVEKELKSSVLKKSLIRSLYVSSAMYAAIFIPDLLITHSKKSHSAGGSVYVTDMMIIASMFVYWGLCGISVLYQPYLVFPFAVGFATLPPGVEVTLGPYANDKPADELEFDELQQGIKESD